MRAARGKGTCDLSDTVLEIIPRLAYPHAVLTMGQGVFTYTNSLNPCNDHGIFTQRFLFMGDRLRWDNTCPKSHSLYDGGQDAHPGTLILDSLSL